MADPAEPTRYAFVDELDTPTGKAPLSQDQAVLIVIDDPHTPGVGLLSSTTRNRHL